MGRTTTRRRGIALAAIVAIALGCGSASDGGATGPGGGTGGSTSNAISVIDNSFSPSATTVPVGTTVTWTWNGSNQHNVTFDDGAKSATQASGTFDRKFDVAGTYKYHCTIHGAAMSGSVTVK